MKIIKRGERLNPTRRVNCRACGSELEYDKSDIKHDWREDDNYIECPVCNENNKKTFISVSR